MYIKVQSINNVLRRDPWLLLSSNPLLCERLVFTAWPTSALHDSALHDQAIRNAVFSRTFKSSFRDVETAGLTLKLNNGTDLKVHKPVVKPVVLGEVLVNSRVKGRWSRRKEGHLIRHVPRAYTTTRTSLISHYISETALSSECTRQSCLYIDFFQSASNILGTSYAMLGASVFRGHWR